MASEPGGLQIRNIGHGFEGRIELVVGQRRSAARLEVDHLVPVRGLREGVKQLGGLLAEGLDQRGIEHPTGVRPHRADGALHTS
jgi:hypothetical protein